MCRSAAYLFVFLTAGAVFSGPGSLTAQEAGPPATNLAPQPLVTRSWKLRYASDLLLADGASLLASMRLHLTPKVGSLDHFANPNRLVAKDVEAVVCEIEKIIKQIDVEPLQVLFDVRFVETDNAAFFKKSISGNRELLEAGFEVLGATQMKAAMRLLKQDPKSRIVQAPKIVALDHRKASIYIGKAKSAAVSRPDSPAKSARSSAGDKAKGRDAVFDRDSLEIGVAPHVVPGTNKLIVDFHVPAASHSGARINAASQVLVSSGQTIVLRYVRPGGRKMVAFVTPQLISPTAIEETVRQAKRRKAMRGK